MVNPPTYSLGIVAYREKHSAVTPAFLRTGSLSPADFDSAFQRDIPCLQTLSHRSDFVCEKQTNVAQSDRMVNSFTSNGEIPVSGYFRCHFHAGIFEYGYSSH
jgi:hypothetical protein